MAFSSAPPPRPCVVPGGGLSPDGQRWVCCRPGFSHSGLYPFAFVRQRATCSEQGTPRDRVLVRGGVTCLLPYSQAYG